MIVLRDLEEPVELTGPTFRWRLSVRKEAFHEYLKMKRKITEAHTKLKIMEKILNC